MYIKAIHPISISKLSKETLESESLNFVHLILRSSSFSLGTRLTFMHPIFLSQSLDDKKAYCFYTKSMPNFYKCKQLDSTLANLLLIKSRGRRRQLHAITNLSQQQPYDPDMDEILTTKCWMKATKILEQTVSQAMAKIVDYIDPR